MTSMITNVRSGPGGGGGGESLPLEVVPDARESPSGKHPNAVVTPLRKVATYEPRIKDKLRKSKRITGH